MIKFSQSFSFGAVESVPLFKCIKKYFNGKYFFILVFSFLKAIEKIYEAPHFINSILDLLAFLEVKQVE